MSSYGASIHAPTLRRVSTPYSAEDTGSIQSQKHQVLVKKEDIIEMLVREDTLHVERRIAALAREAIRMQLLRERAELIVLEETRQHLPRTSQGEFIFVRLRS